ncbi:MAG: prepilin peptidase [Acidisphaera sp.]|nr:prepilin peptidase [Acidisphaera sp.]MBV9812703.1 prepilin peptidase [Acetobacteraceae bacterium]
MIADGLPDWILPLLGAPFVGSLLGVLIRRLPARRPILWARSQCESCGHSLSAAELVPIASWLILRGRCRTCRAPISLFHPAVEVAAIGVAGWAVAQEWHALDRTALVWSDCLLGWPLLALAWIDWQHLRLPDALTLPLLLAGLVVTCWLTPATATEHAAAAAAGYVAFRAIDWFYRRLRGRAGLGQGDAKLMAAAGAWLGLSALPLVATSGAMIGIVWSLARAAVEIVRRPGKIQRSRLLAGTVVPFGPCLALAIWLVWLYG